MVAVFTVFFEGPFWVGVLESYEDGVLTVARHVFGPEPSNPELVEFMLYRFDSVRRSAAPAPAGGSGRPEPRRPGPRGTGRKAVREMGRTVSTKSQAALAAARSELKLERRVSSRDRKEAEADRRYELKAEKRRRKRAGH